MENTELLQELADIIENKFISGAGEIAILAASGGQLARRASIRMGEGMDALLKLKKELGLTSKWKEVGEISTFSYDFGKRHHP